MYLCMSVHRMYFSPCSAYIECMYVCIVLAHMRHFCRTLEVHILYVLYDSYIRSGIHRYTTE